ncbi:hypothetical protein QP157_05925 [Sphingomonas sp. LR61]|uniref:hypothetical protein n=1 Tax=Sphingomonas sp. LR61 TaxID=3050234 RepID=UPI002FE26BFE
MSDPGISPVDDFEAQQRRDDDIDREHVGPYEVDESEESLETVTNDAVAGETVEPQPGDGTDDGPTGGSPREGSPTCGSTTPTRTGRTSEATSAPSRSDPHPLIP